MISNFTFFGTGFYIYLGLKWVGWIRRGGGGEVGVSERIDYVPEFVERVEGFLLPRAEQGSLKDRNKVE